MLVVAVALLCSGMLISLGCLPLVFRMVPPNSVYGIRTPQALDSEEAWLDLNMVGGMLFSLVGFPLMLGGVIGLFLDGEYVAIVGLATTIGCLLTLGFSVYFLRRYSSRYELKKRPPAAVKANNVV